MQPHQRARPLYIRDRSGNKMLAGTTCKTAREIRTDRDRS
jgi:hypothetical protein